MMRVNNTCASGASAIGVPGWPEFAFSTASIARPRTTLIARCSSSLVVTADPFPPRDQPKRRAAQARDKAERGGGPSAATVSGSIQDRGAAEDEQAGGEAVEEVAPSHR